MRSGIPLALLALLLLALHGASASESYFKLRLYREFAHKLLQKNAHVVFHHLTAFPIGDIHVADPLLDFEKTNLTLKATNPKDFELEL